MGKVPEGKLMEPGQWYAGCLLISLFWGVLKAVGLVNTPWWVVLIPLFSLPIALATVCVLCSIFVVGFMVCSIPFHIIDYLKGGKKDAEQES